jgi:hypothetical protein
MILEKSVDLPYRNHRVLRNTVWGPLFELKPRMQVTDNMAQLMNSYVHVLLRMLYYIKSKFNYNWIISFHSSEAASDCTYSYLACK